MPKKVIGLVGPIASGKGTVIDFLKEKGFKAYSTSDVLKEEIAVRGLKITRSTCNAVSNDLRENLGADILAVRTAELIEQDNRELVVIDAIRNLAEIALFKQKFGAKILGIVGDQQKRYAFFVQRGTYTDEIDTFEKFKELDDREMQQEGDYKQQTKACLDAADLIIENNGTMEDLTQKVESFISSEL